jgi:Predicted membrane protein
MVQTRAEAAGLVVQLQRTAVTQGLLFAGIAAVAALSFTTAVIVWIAVAAPEAWRGWALGIVALALLATAVYSAITARRRIRHDTDLIADFTRGLRLDLAMVNLALKDADTEDEEKLAARERAKTAVRDAAAEKAATPSTAEGGDAPSPEGPSVQSAAAAMRAAKPRPDVKQPGVEDSTSAASNTAAVSSTTATGAPQAHAAGPATSPGLAASTRTAGLAGRRGGAYASSGSAAPPTPATAAEREREMPDALLAPEQSAAPGLAGQDTPERRRGHGST